jgi:hypothetical protein
MTNEEMIENLRCVLADVSEQCEQLKSENAALRKKASGAERAFSKLVHEMYENDIRPMCDEKFFMESRLKDAEKELTEEEK